MPRVVIVSAKRTPFGRFRGALAGYAPADLAAVAGNAVLQGFDRSLIDQVILGNVLSAGHGMNIARQVAVKLELPVRTPAFTVNMMCGSGMQSALLAANAIRAGEARAVLAGGTESMSQSPLLISRPAKGQSPNLATAVDSMQRDGLVDSFSNRHMGEQAEELALAFGVSRDEQDAFAERSQRLFSVAMNSDEFAVEVVPVGNVVADQHPRPEMTLATLAQLQPAFQADGTVTGGNASGINDGAGILLLAERDYAMGQGWPVLAEWIDGVIVGCDPARMGLGPVHAIRSLLKRTNREWSDVDTLEINEAFAAQTLACLREMHLSPGLSAVSKQLKMPSGHVMDFNSEGGAIAIGHPLAASGARLLTHLAWKIARGGSRSAIGSLCIGGGMGIAAMLAASPLKTTRTSYQGSERRLSRRADRRS